MRAVYECNDNNCKTIDEVSDMTRTAIKICTILQDEVSAMTSAIKKTSAVKMNADTNTNQDQNQAR
jgi:nitrogen regulatory protein PII-like uncharacterized protein